jgi:hypothetical protein
MSRRLAPAILATLAVAAAAATCADPPPAAPEPPPPLPADTLPPRLDLHLVVETDSTARIEGTISDDRGVTLAIWGAQRPELAPDVQDTLRFAPTRELPVRVQLPPRPWGTFRVGMAAADAAGHYAFWNAFWRAGPRALRIDSFELVPASDTLRQPGVEFTPTVSGPAGIREMYVLADAGTAAERRFDVSPLYFGGKPAPYEQPRRVGVRVPPALPNGPHRLTLVVVDSTGATRDTTLRYVVHVPEVAYRVRFLGTLGGGDSRALDLNAAGDVAGDAPTAAGVTRGFVWRGGVLRELPTPEPGPSSAVALNDVGDVVGTARVGGTTAGVVWSGTAAPAPLTVDGGQVDVVVDVNDARLVLGVSYRIGSVLYQLGSGLVTRLGPGPTPTAMNARAQGIAPTYSLYTDAIAAWGDGMRITLPPRRPGTGDIFGRGFRAYPIAIDDAGEVLGTMEGEHFLSQLTTARYLTQYLPGTSRALSPGGEVLAMAGPRGDSLFVWNRATGTRRVLLADRDWTIDAVTRLNDRGVIAGHGTNARTGERGAVVLVPAAGPSLARKGTP